MTLRAPTRQAGGLTRRGEIRAEAAAPKRAARSRAEMKYVYILQSVEFSQRFYIGVTEDLRARLDKHNAGDISYTSKFRPWRVKTYIAFDDDKQALAFELYLKRLLDAPSLRNGYRCSS